MLYAEPQRIWVIDGVSRLFGTASYWEHFIAGRLFSTAGCRLPACRLFSTELQRRPALLVAGCSALLAASGFGAIAMDA